MFGFHFNREWAALWRSPVRVLAVMVYALMSVWALADGLGWQSQLRTIQAETPASLFHDREEWIDVMRQAEAGEEVSPYAGRPMSLTSLAVHTPGDLAALAHRNEAIQPHTALISGWRSEASLFRRYEVEGPAVLRAGRLDLAFVVIVLMPIFLMLLSFDVLSQERGSGRFRVFLMQGGSATSLLGARILSAALPLATIPIVCVLIASILNGGAIGQSALWMFAVVAYAIFWAGISAIIGAYTARPAAGAMAVLASWAVIVVLLPSASQFLAQALHPAPSRVTYLSEARDAEGETRRNLEARAEIYMAEHPGQGNAPDDAVPGFYRASYLANVDINARTAPLVEAYETRQAAQRRFVGFAGLLSPAMIAQDVFFDASGTGPARAASFRRQARDHLAEIVDLIGPATVNRSRLSVAQAEAMPYFEFTAPPVPISAWLGLLWMAVIGSAAWLIGMRGAAARS